MENPAVAKLPLPSQSFPPTLPADAVTGVSLTAPSIATEGRNVSLSCTWTAGTEVTVRWGKDGAAVVADSRITISGGSLVINPSRRSDAGEYTCTASNPVSAQTATRTVTVYCEFLDRWRLLWPGQATAVYIFATLHCM